MKVLVLGFGLQGRAVVHDLEQAGPVSEIVVADLDPQRIRGALEPKGYRKCRVVGLDVSRGGDLHELIATIAPRVIISMLPADFDYPVARAALTAGCNFVSSSYAGRVVELDPEARSKGVTFLPEMGMDPGIDLVMGRLAVNELDVVHGLYSYGTGLPEPDCAADNPLRYKITWTFDGVLKAYKRPARILKDGVEVTIAGEDIFREEHGHILEIPGFGPLEAYPNGDAIGYIRLFDLGAEVRDMGRFALRYPGHRRFWSAMTKLGFLDDEVLPIGGASISPRQFLVRQLAPKLQFAANERDVIILRVTAWGLKKGRLRRITYQLIDYRDLNTGFFAMNRTVGYTASIAAQMILTGRITASGVLSPTRDVPPMDLMHELEARGMKFERRFEENENL